MRAHIYTRISWWIYRTLKTDQSFSTPRSLHLSSPLSALSLLILQSKCIMQKGERGVTCVHLRAHLPRVCECTCVARVCAYTFNVSLCEYACMHTAVCA